MEDGLTEAKREVEGFKKHLGSKLTGLGDWLAGREKTPPGMRPRSSRLGTRGQGWHLLRCRGAFTAVGQGGKVRSSV